jgi:hypothetical protein
MRRIGELCLAVLFCLGLGWAQDTTQRQMMQPGPPTAQNRMAMHQQMMQSMRADVDSMKANLQKMKDQLGSIKDPGAKAQAELNIAMWQSLVDDLDTHLQVIQGFMGRRGMWHDQGTMGPHDNDYQHMHGAPAPTPTPKQ